MIKYKLECKNCSKTFDSWFSSSKEFDRIKSLKLLNCNYCKSKNIDKTLMAPNVKLIKKSKITQNINKFKEFKKRNKKLSKFYKK